MAQSFDAAERRKIQEAVTAGIGAQCPVCAVQLSEQTVSPKPELPYVRRRLWVLCPQCRRTATVDLPHHRGHR